MKLVLHLGTPFLHLFSSPYGHGLRACQINQILD